MPTLLRAFGAFCIGTMVALPDEAEKLHEILKRIGDG